MPILQRIEIANFLNSGREKPWRPDWPHQIFEINGENAALNIPNGKGKSTITTSILSMLTYHGKSLKDIRTRFFAPSMTGHFTHLRIQILIPIAGAGGDLITQAGGDIGGQPMVFGMYGYSGENDKLELYSYQGTFEDCPVAHVHQLHHIPVPDDAFLGQLKTCTNLFPSNHKERSKRAWLAFVEDFFDMSSLKQQLIYQLMRGAEGGHSYFDVKPPVGMNYSAAVFYERLAPELLTDVMGDLGEEGEHGIEDTIHEKVSKVIAAKRETERKAKELFRAENTLKQLVGLRGAVDDLSKTRQEYQKHQARLSIEFEALRKAVIESPIPGIPKTPPEGVPSIARTMVMQDGKWFLADRVIAEFTGETASAINQRARDRNGLALTQANRSQLIDFACDSFSVIGKRGPATSLYSREASITLLNVISNFTRSWTRDSAIEAVMRAFDWVEANADTNPARQLSLQLSLVDEKKKGAIQALREASGVLNEEKDRLLTEQSTIDAQQAEYRRMTDSGLFSTEELARPLQTGQVVANAFRIATENLETHKNKVRDLKPIDDLWMSFVKEFGDTSVPAEQAELLSQKKINTEQALVKLKQDLVGVRSQLKIAEGEKTQAETEFRKIDAKLNRFSETYPATVRFFELFGSLPTAGLEQQVTEDRDKARSRIAEIARERDRYRAPLAALSSFKSANADEHPDEWLTRRLEKWSELGEEITSTQTALSEAESRLAAFDQSVIVAGRVAREAAEAAGGDYIPMYEAIDDMRLPDHLREKVLTLFSALLHSPVYRTVADATAAAKRLAEAEIEAPVFVRAELDAFCRTGDISVDSITAHTWLVGIRTRQVDCLLDPTLVEREKARERERISVLSADIKSFTEDRSNYSPEDEAAQQARLAAEAIKHNYLAKDAELSEQETTLAEALPNLERNASPDSLDVIRQTVRHQKEFDEIDKTVLQEQREVAYVSQEQSKEKFETLSEKRDELAGLIEEAQEKLANATVAASRIPDLTKIQSYIDHPENNPSFMRSAEAVDHALTDIRDTADKRTRFQFDLAALFVEKGYDRPKEIERRLKEIGDELKDIHDKKIPSALKEQEEVQNRLIELITQVREIDDFARLLIGKYRSFAAEQSELVSVAKEQVERHTLWEWAVVLQEEASTESRIRSLLDAAIDIDVEDSADITKEVVRAKSVFSAAKNTFEQSIERMLILPDLDMSEHVRIELQRAIETPEVIEHLYSVANQNYEKNMAANTTAAEYLDGEWENLGKWLKAFTQRLPDNLKTMKEVFGPVKDKVTNEYCSAGFEIEATLVSQDDVKAVLDEVVQKVEKFEATRKVIENAAPNLRDQAVRGIRDEIRSTFYQKVVTAPRIKVVMPSISKHALPLEKNMVSTGQGVAMTLLWIVKMADYITEREMRRMTTNRVQQKHLHPTQFALMDGAFSSLSNKGLIRDALDSIKRTRGRFQLIITGHDENYQNNFEYFPTLIEAREVNGQFMYADSQTRRILQPEDVGSHFGAMGVMNLRIKPAEPGRLTAS